MAKLKLSGKDLREIGYPQGPVIAAAISIAAEHYPNFTKKEVLKILEHVLLHPVNYATDKTLGKIAQFLIPKQKDETEMYLNNTGVNVNIFGEDFIERGAIEQIQTAARLPIAFSAALMPDAHQGYGLPIGGVLATENAVIPYGVGVDIGCFTGETKVKLTDGRALTFLELIEEEKAGKENFTFSIDESNNVVLSRIQAPRQTRVVNELIEITLDTGETYRCTTDHVHYLRNGKEIRAADLKPNDSLMPCYVDLGRNVPLEKKSYRDKKVKLEDYFVVYNPNTGFYDYVHFLADAYNLEHGLYSKNAGNIRHHKDFNKHNNNPANIARVGYKEHFAIHSSHVKYTNQQGITGFKKARKKNPDFFAKMGSENMTKNHQNPDFAKRRNERAAETFKRYNQTAAFYNMTRKAGERGKSYLVAKNKSEEGREKSKQVSQKKYQCPVCSEVVTGGFGIYNHTQKSKACSVQNGNYKSFSEVKNHKVVAINKVVCPNTPVYCLTIDEHENFALDAGIFVHNCRMCLSVFDINPEELTTKQKTFSTLIEENTLFGAGKDFKKPTDHDVLYRPEFNEVGILKSLKATAAAQLGSSGSGNHFVEFGIVDIKERDPVLGIPAGSYVGLLSHSGSRAVGANVANHFTRLAKEKRKLQPSAANLAWLNLAEEAGAEYWLAMNLAGDYASACHHVIHDKIKVALGQQPLKMVENHHNFAWKEEHEGREVIVHRKGATPAGKDVLGIIPGSMTAPGFIVKGKGNEGSLHSASHGAGRKMSRTAALKEITQSTLQEALQRHGVKLMGGGLDEAPLAYKDIYRVMQAQHHLVDTVGLFHPKIVKMDGSAPKQWKKKGAILSGE